MLERKGVRAGGGYGSWTCVFPARHGLLEVFDASKSLGLEL